MRKRRARRQHQERRVRFTLRALRRFHQEHDAADREINNTTSAAGVGSTSIEAPINTVSRTIATASDPAPAAGGIARGADAIHFTVDSEVSFLTTTTNIRGLATGSAGSVNNIDQVKLH